MYMKTIFYAMSCHVSYHLPYHVSYHVNLRIMLEFLTIVNFVLIAGPFALFSNNDNGSDSDKHRQPGEVTIV